MSEEKIKKEYERIESLSKNPQSTLLAMLHFIQKEKGFITEQDAEYLSSISKIPYSKVKAVMTFYTMYNLKKTGIHHIQICRNLSCHMAGAPALKKIIENELSIKEGEVTPDGLFSLTEVECLGSCGTAPVIMINETYHENMNEEKLKALLKELKEKNENTTR